MALPGRDTKRRGPIVSGGIEFRTSRQQELDHSGVAPDGGDIERRNTILSGSTDVLRPVDCEPIPYSPDRCKDPESKALWQVSTCPVVGLPLEMLCRFRRGEIPVQAGAGFAQKVVCAPGKALHHRKNVNAAFRFK
jgi:hypothetical protein